jgi:hypothetical protein
MCSLREATRKEGCRVLYAVRRMGKRRHGRNKKQKRIKGRRKQIKEKVKIIMQRKSEK